MSANRLECDVLITGGGAAGVAAAAGAASLGARVAIVERYGFFGGMGTAAAVGTVCGLYRSGDEARYLVTGFARDFAERLRERSRSSPARFGEGAWYLPYEPFELACLLDGVVRERGIAPKLHTVLCGLEREGARAASARAWEHDGPLEIRFGAVVDCSGEASVCALAGDDMIEPAKLQAGAAVFTLCGTDEIDPDLFRKHVAKSVAEGIADGKLGDHARLLSVAPGGYGGGIARFKLSLPQAASPDRRPGEIEMHARAAILEISSHLVSACEPLRRARLSHAAPQIGIRTGRRPAGMAVLEEEDVIGCRKREDRIASCAWPIEEWGEARGPLMTYLPPGDHYDVPLGCLRSRRIENLFFAGRNISASERAIGSARVIGTCLSTGYAAGLAASLFAAGRSPEEAPGLLRSLE